MILLFHSLQEVYYFSRTIGFRSKKNEDSCPISANTGGVRGYLFQLLVGHNDAVVPNEQIQEAQTGRKNPDMIQM